MTNNPGVFYDEISLQALQYVVLMGGQCDYDYLLWRQVLKFNTRD